VPWATAALLETSSITIGRASQTILDFMLLPSQPGTSQRKRIQMVCYANPAQSNVSRPRESRRRKAMLCGYRRGDGYFKGCANQPAEIA
jgi:hypothetical protein